MTPAQMHEGGIGPYAGRAVATAQTGGDGETREFETQPIARAGGGGCRAVAARSPTTSRRAAGLEARCALEALERRGRGRGRRTPRGGGAEA